VKADDNKQKDDYMCVDNNQHIAVESTNPNPDNTQGNQLYIMHTHTYIIIYTYTCMYI